MVWNPKYVSSGFVMKLLDGGQVEATSQHADLAYASPPLSWSDQAFKGWSGHGQGGSGVASRDLVGFGVYTSPLKLKVR